MRISTRWIRELSILFINCIDLSRCKSGTKPDSVIKYAKMIAKEWTDDRVYPPYHEWVDNILQLSDLRRFKFASQTGSAKTAGKAKSGKSGNQDDLEELKALMELRKTSAVFKKAAMQKM